MLWSCSSARVPVCPHFPCSRPTGGLKQLCGERSMTEPRWGEGLLQAALGLQNSSQMLLSAAKWDSSSRPNDLIYCMELMERLCLLYHCSQLPHTWKTHCEILLVLLDRFSFPSAPFNRSEADFRDPWTRPSSLRKSKVTDTQEGERQRSPQTNQSQRIFNVRSP